VIPYWFTVGLTGTIYVSSLYIASLYIASLLRRRRT